MYQSAIKYKKIQMEIYKKFYLNKYDVQIADIYNTLGILQGELKNYDKEIEYYEKGY